MRFCIESPNSLEHCIALDAVRSAMTKRNPKRTGASTHKRLDILLLDIWQVMGVPVSMWGEDGILEHPTEREVGDVMQSNAVASRKRIKPLGLAAKALDDVHVICLHARENLCCKVERDDAVLAAAQCDDDCVFARLLARRHCSAAQ